MEKEMLYPTVRVGTDAGNVFEHFSAVDCEVSISAKELNIYRYILKNSTY